MRKPTLLEEVELFRGLRFRVVRRKYLKDDGVFARDVVIFPQAVVVLPIVSENEVILIRQFRAPLGDFIIEAPAGVLEDNESPEETARRELVEEIGYYPHKLVRLGSYTPCPGYSSEILHFYYAEDLEYIGAKPEKYEIIEPFKVSFERAYEMVINNEIKDLKTALAILLYGQVKRRIK